MRKPYIVGNWKMNCMLADARALVDGILEGFGDVSEKVDVGFAPPAYLLMPMCRIVADSPVKLGAQNVYHQPKGAFTGEIAPSMLIDAGCSFVIIGHSERRQIFGESGEMLLNKVQAAIDAGLEVIYCIGETLEQREAGQTNDVLQRQLSEAMVDSLQWQKVTVAYEPVWAIGTGKVATLEQAQEAHLFVRNWLKAKYGPDAADAMRIQYGGSVKPSNAEDLLKMPDVDGGLVGGASLKAADFLGIITAAS